MEQVLDLLITFFLVIGGVFGLVGSFGLIKLNDPMSRLHAPTKATTLGVGGVLVASMIYFPVHHGLYTAHELLITLFLFISAPITANMIAKAHLHRQGTRIDPNPADNIQEGLPESEIWATFHVETANGTEDAGSDLVKDLERR